jgi:hypothetical protein
MKVKVISAVKFGGKVRHEGEILEVDEKGLAVLEPTGCVEPHKPEPKKAEKQAE